MDSLTPRQVLGIVAVFATFIVCAVLGAFDQRGLMLLGLVTLVGAAAVGYAGSGGVSRGTLDRLQNSARQLLDGTRPTTPAGASPELTRLYEALAEVADAHSHAV